MRSRALSIGCSLSSSSAAECWADSSACARPRRWRVSAARSSSPLPASSSSSRSTCWCAAVAGFDSLHEVDAPPSFGGSHAVAISAAPVFDPKNVRWPRLGFASVWLPRRPHGPIGPSMAPMRRWGVDDARHPAPNALPQVRAGAIKAYAITAGSRLAAAPDIPTVDEQGLPGVHISIWQALFAPKGTPKTIIAKLNAAVMDALADPAMRGRLADLGQYVFPRDQQTPEALDAFHEAEIAKWWPIIKAAGISTK